MKQERLSRRGGRGVDAGWGPLWPPAVSLQEGAQDGQENPTGGHPQGAPLHSQPPLPLRDPRSRFLRLMRIGADLSALIGINRR